MNVSKYYWVREEQPWIGTPSPYDDPTDRNESIHLVVLVPAGGEYEYKRMYWALTRHLAPPQPL